MYSYSSAFAKYRQLRDWFSDNIYYQGATARYTQGWYLYHAFSGLLMEAKDGLKLYDEGQFKKYYKDQRGYGTPACYHDLAMIFTVCKGIKGPRIRKQILTIAEKLAAEPSEAKYEKLLIQAFEFLYKSRNGVLFKTDLRAYYEQEVQRTGLAKKLFQPILDNYAEMEREEAEDNWRFAESERKWMRDNGY